ncbi:hypothetical protein AB0P21_13770 [Kribbella sp. NPDC056861]|uniref:hypothetical protein n=1 Tax=Kribbella sp. NPDC056861 TaxID=3154857 RepID=UPI0034173156
MTRTPRRLSRQFLGLGISAAALTIALTGCGSQPTVSAPPPAAAAAEHNHADHEHSDAHEDGSLANTIVDEPLAGADLQTLTKSTQLAVRGKITTVQTGVLLAKGDTSAKYSVFTIKVADTARGKAQPTVQLALLQEIYGAAVVVEERPNPKVGDEVVALMTKIAPEFNHPGYVLTSQASLMLVKPDGQVVAGIEGSSPVAAQAKSLRTVDQVLATIRAVK